MTYQNGLASGIKDYSNPFFAGTLFASNNVNQNDAQPAFFAYLSVNDPDVTGDGTGYQIPFDQVYFDQNGDFSVGINARFTAPEDGTYLFTFNVSSEDYGAAHTEYLTQMFINDSIQFQFNRCNPYVSRAALSGTFETGFSVVPIFLTAGDTCKFYIAVIGGTKTVDLVGSGGAYFPTFVSGFFFA